MRTIGVVTTSRADYSIYYPLLCMLRDDPSIRLQLFVTGMHFLPRYGLTYKIIEADDFEITEKIAISFSSDSPADTARAIGATTSAFASVFDRNPLDILVVLGDRFEMFAVVAAAVPLNIPIAHLYGGELTEGAIDDVFRHAITKMSHLHFTSTQVYAQRVIQMGEEPWRVTVSGISSLDNLLHIPLLNRDQISDQIGAKITDKTLLVTYHPVTMEMESTAEQVAALLDAIALSGYQAIFTFPNMDAKSNIIIQMIEAFVNKHDNMQVAVNLGTQLYFSVMNEVAAMVGNSSSGITEAASFHLPVVNIGNRQRGRFHDRNVIDVGYTMEAILRGIQLATSQEFRVGLANLQNPYGDGHAAERIFNVLKQVSLDKKLIVKHFYTP